VGTPFIAEVKLISWNFAPTGWAFCNGQLLQINQNQALFSILGTNYGGNGQTTFALPDLRGRVPVHTGGPIGAIVGGVGGEESHTLIQSEMPAHIHQLSAVSGAGTVILPGGNFLAKSDTQIYQSPNNLVPMVDSSIGNAGGSQPHENRSPFLVLNFIIALNGIFPSRN
jgi:microcystin-dependent protein